MSAALMFCFSVMNISKVCKKNMKRLKQKWSHILATCQLSICHILLFASAITELQKKTIFTGQLAEFPLQRVRRRTEQNT